MVNHSNSHRSDRTGQGSCIAEWLRWDQSHCTVEQSLILHKGSHSGEAAKLPRRVANSAVRAGGVVKDRRRLAELRHMLL